MNSNRWFLWILALAGVCGLAGCRPGLMDTAGGETLVPTATLEQLTPTDSPIPSPTVSPTAETRFLETGGEIPFSYVAPAGWTSEKSFAFQLTNWYGPEQPATVCLTLSYVEEDGTYKTVASCRNNAILVFILTPFDGSPKDFFAERVSGLISYREESSVESEEAFPTPTDDQSYRVIFTYLDQEQRVRIALYFFHRSGQILVSGYARLADGESSPDADVEAAVQSLRFEE